MRFKWSLAKSYFAFAALFFLAAAGSAPIGWLGPRMTYAFSLLCSVFLVFGALEAKRPPNKKEVDKG